MLAKKDFKRVLEYDLNSHGLAEGLSGDIILPDLLRMKGQALIALDRIDEARETLVKAQEIPEVCGSLYGVSSTSRAELRQSKAGRKMKSNCSFNQCRDLIDYIANLCGRPEVRERFLNHPVVRNALAND